MCWKDLSPRRKVMLICSLIPLFLFMVVLLGGYSLISWLINPLDFTMSMISNGGATIMYREETFSSIFTNLLSWVVVYGIIGFLSGWLYELGKKRTESWIIGLLFALIPWLLWLLLLYSFFRVVFV